MTEAQRIFTDEESEVMVALLEWRDAAAPVERVMDAIDCMIIRRIEDAFRGARVQLQTTRVNSTAEHGN